ncbi:MAG: tetratricopeptide repeat protein [Myxococcota bacterium]
MMLGWLGMTLAWGEPTGSPPVEDAGVEDHQAMSIFDNGRRLYDEGQYEQAIVAFERALELSSRPELYFDIANAKERLGDLQGAIDALMMYRIYAEPIEQDILRARVDALRARLAAAEMQALEPPPVDLMQRRRTSAAWALAGFGGVLAAAGGTVAAVTYAQGRQSLGEGDRESWERIRPVNNAALGTALGGVAVGITGVTLAFKLGQPVESQ